MMANPKVCADCKHSYTLAKSPKYRRCEREPSVSAGSDATLCGNMRSARGACGPDATLFEARVTDGQA